MTSTVLIHSVPYKKEILVSKELMRQCFPESIFTTTLELHDTDRIDILAPEVTPIILDALKYIITNKGQLPPEVKDCDYLSAANYLGIDELLLIPEGNMSGLIRDYPHIDIKHPSVYEYLAVMSYAITTNAVWLARYITRKIRPDETKGLDEGLVRDAVKADRTELYPLFTARGQNIDRAYIMVTSEALVTNNWAIVRRHVLSGRVPIKRVFDMGPAQLRDTIIKNVYP